MIRIVPTFCAALVATTLLTRSASAQTAQGAIVSTAIGAAAIDSNTSVAIAASAGYRFNRAMGLTVELTYVPSLDSESDFGIPVPALTRISQRRDLDARLTLFTTNIRLEMPTTSRRVLPFAVLGGGVANIRNEFDVVFALPVLPVDATGLGFPIPINPIVDRYTQSSTELALTLGGGVSVFWGDHLSIDGDLRYLRLLGSEDRNVGRFGAGVSYRF
jgi:opacity protein-like surface antigen